MNRTGLSAGNAVIGRSEDGAKLRVRRKGKGSYPFEERPGLHHTIVSNMQFSGEGFEKLDDLRRDVGTWRATNLDPRDALRAAQPPREVTDIGARGQWLVPFLHRLQEYEFHRKDFRAIVRAMRVVIPGIEEICTELVRSRGEVELQVKQDGIWMSARVVSEGTLRVLALYAMTADPFARGLIAFEEPEKGVHPRRIEQITGILVAAARAPRQVVVTTHSPLVVGDVIRRVRAGALEAEQVRRLIASSRASGTLLRRFDPIGPVFDDAAVDAALTEPDYADRV